MVEEAIAAAEVVYTEIALDSEGMAEMQKQSQLPPGQKLSNLLPADLYERLEQEFKRINPALSLKLFDGFKIWAAMSAPLPSNSSSNFR